MSEEKIILKTKTPNTIISIYQDLMNLGIHDGDILLVHSSLSSIGWVCGGAQAVITALLKAAGTNGTLVMPAHSGDWSDPAKWQNPPVPKEWIPIIYENMPPYEPELTPTRGMGRIAELFRTFPNTIRSNHPQVSFCANGKLAKHIVEGHPITPGLGMDSPLGKLYSLNAKVLLLGVGYGSCTSFHLAETLIHNMPKIKMGTAISGEESWKWFEDYDYNADDFKALGKDFEKLGKVKDGNIGSADCKMFKIQDGVNFAQKWLIKNRLGENYMK
ncbi:MAG: AAC(3) family N-acetyltransferase [Anaerocolumna sp.]